MSVIILSVFVTYGLLGAAVLAVMLWEAVENFFSKS